MSTLKATTSEAEESVMVEYPKRAASRCPTHPGAMLREIVLPALKRSKVEIAEALGVSRQTLYDILTERQPVTPAMAVRLAAVFDTTPASWLTMQNAYDLWHATQGVDVSRLRKLVAAA